jgi:hypothetical protein
MSRIAKKESIICGCLGLGKMGDSGVMVKEYGVYSESNKMFQN